jgi:uncharacterized protein
VSPVRRFFDVRSRMRDGVELSSDLWLPGSEGQYPLILLRTPYLKTSQPGELNYSMLAKVFAERGYAVAVQDVRGRGDSDGTYGYYFQEGADGYDTIEWMAAQPWCNGRVGMMGPSYMGAAQWYAARHRPPHLVCIAPVVSPGDYFNELPCVGGAFLQYRLQWCNSVAGRVPQTNVRDDEWAAILKHRPLLSLDEELGRKLPLYRQWLEHDTLDEYWKPLLLSEADYRRIDIPALHIGGLFDIYLCGTLRYWQGMARYSPAANHQYLIVGPWDHVQAFTGGARKMGELELSDDSLLDVLQLHLRFFDCYLKGSAIRFSAPRVRLYVTGCNQWRECDAYPVSAVQNRKLYLSSQGGANSALGDGRLVVTPPGDAPPDRYAYDPQDPIPLDAFAPGGIYAVDRRLLEQRDDVLVYTGEVQSKSLEVLGQVSVELYAASDVLDTDFTASILDVYPDGRAVALGAKVVGIIRARYRHSLHQTQLLTPGKIEKYRIDLGHIAHAFRPGHCIRIEISSSAAPWYHPNPNTGNPIATDIGSRVARQTIYHDAQRPSALLLPIANCA